jgi:hypothetical protein
MYRREDTVTSEEDLTRQLKESVSPLSFSTSGISKSLIVMLLVFDGEILNEYLESTK